MRQTARAASPHMKHLAQCERISHRPLFARRTACLSCQREQPCCADGAPRAFSSIAVRRARNSSSMFAPTEPQSSTPNEGQEPVLVGGSDEADSEITKADMREYNRRQRNEERAAYQESIDKAADHEDYVPAGTWSGLRRIGGKFDWPKNDRPKYRGFVPSDKITDPREILHAVNRAAVEVFAAHSNKLPLKKLPRAGPDELLETAAPYVKLKPSADGQGVVLEFETQQIKDEIMLHVNGQGLSKDANTMDETEVDEMSIEDQGGIASKVTGSEAPITPIGSAAEDEAAARSEETEDVLDDSDLSQYEQDRETVLSETHFGKEWNAVPISNPIIKLAIARRVMQLTGHVFPDPTLQSSETLGQLVTYLRRKIAQPANVFQTVVGKDASEFVDEKLYLSRANASRNLSSVEADDKGALANLSNVVISGRRVSMVDKEKSVGRWKVIEDELQKRGLPLPGEEQRLKDQARSGVYE